jgi:hypothetical protein
VLGDTSEWYSLVASLARVAEEVENWINTTTANGIQCGPDLLRLLPCHIFPKLGPELELLGSQWDADLSDDQVDALWPLVSAALDSLASLVPSSLARNPPDDAK